MDEVASNGSISSAAAARVSPGPSSNADNKRMPSQAQLTAEESSPTKRAKSGDGQRSSTVPTRTKSAHVAVSQEEDSTSSSAMPDAPTSGVPQQPTENVRVPPPVASEAGVLGDPCASQDLTARDLLREGVSAAPASAQVVSHARGNRTNLEAATKSFDAIQEEVRELLEDKLVGKEDVAFKVTVLRTLTGYFTDKKNGAYQHMSAYRDAVSKFHGCHLVLVVLRQELAMVDDPSRDIVLCAIQFLAWWNCSCATNRNEMSKVNGVGTVVSVMESYHNDRRIQDWSISCLFNFTIDNDAKRREELAKGNAIVHIFRAMTEQLNAAIQKHCVIVLGRLCDLAGAHHLDGLVEMGALEALVKVYKYHKNSNDPRREEICASCRKWMTKLVV